ncbi:MAG TPA: hypothetical protein PLW65_27975 [Pseudomonadota bacterium]|nr:hypothetical protein [Pseudomonadota bacterium]
MAEWQAVGKHLYYLQDDVLVMKTRGALELPDAQWVMATAEALVQKNGYSLLLGDVSAGMSISPEVRRWIGEWHKSHPQAASDGTAIAFGANPIVSTLLRLINSGVRLLGISNGDLALARNEADAWAILAQRRKLWRERILARRAAKTAK